MSITAIWVTRLSSLLLFDGGLTLDNRFTPSGILQNVQLFIIGGIAVFKWFHKSEDDRGTLAQTKASMEKQQSQITEMLAIQGKQQNLIERIPEQITEWRKEHREQLKDFKEEYDERTRRIEDRLFFDPPERRMREDRQQSQRRREEDV
jgi:hypothetical protein